MRSVIVTGGSGSFGRAFVRHILSDRNIDRIAILSRDEHKQADMARELAPLDSNGRLRFFIGDVRDKSRLCRAFRGCDTVVHAAALKRIEVGVYNPDEMVKTNVGGAMNAVEAAAEAGVRKVVALSTDKAWQPISPYGQSKALAEMLFLNANNAHGKSGPIYSVVRYGNVWASKGSVVPTWRKLLETSNTVPVTDPEATRFFMTMAGAVRLVLDALRSPAAELCIPMELPAYRLGDLAEAMGAKMDVRGLPAFEKLHEGMCDGNTSDIARRMSIDELRTALKETA